jgi:PPOX class probable F420-dependent enzyme
MDLRAALDMNLSAALDLARSTRQSVLTTIRANGRPQLSNVLHHVFDDGVIGVSITADRAKYKNLVREPWAALHVTRDDFFAYAVIEGAVDLTPVAARTDDATVEALVDYYRALMGEHENWTAYREAMVADRRVLVRLRPERAYGMLELPPPTESEAGAAEAGN